MTLIKGLILSTVYTVGLSYLGAVIYANAVAAGADPMTQALFIILMFINGQFAAKLFGSK